MKSYNRYVIILIIAMLGNYLNVGLGTENNKKIHLDLPRSILGKFNMLDNYGQINKNSNKVNNIIEYYLKEILPVIEKSDLLKLGINHQNEFEQILIDNISLHAEFGNYIRNYTQFYTQNNISNKNNVPKISLIHKNDILAFINKIYLKASIEMKNDLDIVYKWIENAEGKTLLELIKELSEYLGGEDVTYISNSTGLNSEHVLRLSNESGPGRTVGGRLNGSNFINIDPLTEPYDATVTLTYETGGPAYFSFVSDPSEHLISWCISKGDDDIVTNGTYGTFGSGAGQLNSPHGVDARVLYMPDGTKYIYVVIADTDNGRIVLLKINNTIHNDLQVLSETYIGAGVLTAPMGVSIQDDRDPFDAHPEYSLNPNIYVTDPAGNQILKFDFNGNVVFTCSQIWKHDWPTMINISDLSGIDRITRLRRDMHDLSPNGSIYLPTYTIEWKYFTFQYVFGQGYCIIDNNSNTLFLVGAWTGGDGNIISYYEFDSDEQLGSIGTDMEGNIWITSENKCLLYKLKPIIGSNGNYEMTLLAKYGTYGAGNKQFLYPNIVEQVADGSHLFVGEELTNYTGARLYRHVTDILELESQFTETGKFKLNFILPTASDIELDLIQSDGTIVDYGTYHEEDSGLWEFTSLTAPNIIDYENTQVKVTATSIFNGLYGIEEAVTVEKTVPVNPFPLPQDPISQGITTLKGYCIVEDDVIIQNGNLVINPGTIIEMSPGSKITVNYGSRIEANGITTNPIRFKRSNINEPWDTILLEGNNNLFYSCVFDGGTYNVDIRSNNNEFVACRFKNADRGISTYLHSQEGTWSNFLLNNCIIENNTYGVVTNYTYGSMYCCEINNNNKYGLYMYNARIGNNGSMFHRNYIHNNGTFGIKLGHNGKIWLFDDVPFLGGDNKITNNNSHEIYLSSSTSSRIYGGSENGGLSYISDSPDTYYIYNLAQTYDGEFYTSWIVDAEYNYWGTPEGPNSENFYGPVIYDPFLEEFDGDPGPWVIPPEKTSNNKSVNVLENGKDPISLLQRIQNLRNLIQNNPFNIFNGSRLNNLYSLLDYDPQDSLKFRILVVNLIDATINKLLNIGRLFPGASPDTLKAIQLSGQTAMTLKINYIYNTQDFDEVINMVNQYSPHIINSDLKRELLMHKLAALENKKLYAEALAVLNELRRGVQANFTYYTAPTFEIVEQNLLVQMGLNPNKSSTEGLNITSKIETDNLPDKFELHQNYPNPFNPVTNIPISLPEKSHVRIIVYNILGQRVATITDKVFEAGRYEYKYYGRNIASGMYIIRAMVQSKINKDNKFDFKKKILFLK